MLRIAQLNLGRARAAHDAAFADAQKNKVDMMMISEPNVKVATGKKWIIDKKGDVAIAFLNKNLEIDEINAKEGYIHVKLYGIHLFIIYISPNISLQLFKRKVDTVFQEISRHSKTSIMVGDVNSKSQTWGAFQKDKRGEYIEEWLSQLNWTARNDGGHTFERGNSRTHIDVTLCSVDMFRKIKNWEIKYENPFTQHGQIYLNVASENIRRERDRVMCFLRVSEYINKLKEIKSDIPGKIYEEILNAYRTSIGRDEINQREVPYWWNENIEEARNRYIRARRKHSRLKSQGYTEQGTLEQCKREMREEAGRMKTLIRTSKRERWKRLVAELNEDIWGEGYRLVTGQLANGDRHSIPVSKRKKILKDLFPATRERLVHAERTPADPEPFTEGALKAALKRMKNGKAPGPDGLTVEALKIAGEIIPENLLKMLNQQLKETKFPKKFKEARVVLLPKAGKDQKLSSSYRPICLINTMAKLYERLIVDRLEAETEEKKTISESQHGFRRGKSTVTAMLEVKSRVERSEARWCVLVAIDIKNAFNTAKWQTILTSLRNANMSDYIIQCVEDYFRDRVVKAGIVAHKCCMGVPQGSVFGPMLWNLSYDRVLRLDYGPRVSAVAYADDLMFVVEAENEGDAKNRSEQAVQTASRCLQEMGLEMAPHKTEILVVKGPRDTKDFGIEINGVDVRSKPEMKYLGVTFTKRLNFGHHIEDIIKKAETKCAALSRIMPNIGGPSYSKRLLLSGVVHSILLYAAPVWREGLQINTNREKLRSAQRRVLLRVASAYRTVSAEALQVITGVPPIDLMIAERCFLFKVGGRLPGNRRMAQRRTRTKWQERWTRETDTAVWTRRLIANLEPWVECQHRVTNYFLTQFFTGHGSFRCFTHRIGKAPDNLCHTCNEEDSAEHMFAKCERWREERAKMVEELTCMPAIEEIAGLMTENRKNWRIIANYITEVITRKEREDRERDG